MKFKAFVAFVIFLAAILNIAKSNPIEPIGDAQMLEQVNTVSTESTDTQQEAIQTSENKSEPLTMADELSDNNEKILNLKSRVFQSKHGDDSRFFAPFDEDQVESNKLLAKTVNVFSSDDLEKYQDRKRSGATDDVFSNLDLYENKKTIQLKDSPSTYKREPSYSKNSKDVDKPLQGININNGGIRFNRNRLTPLEKIFAGFFEERFIVTSLLIINNNNNNNNIDEDKFSLDEIMKLLDQREYITTKDVLDYDQSKRIKYLRAKEKNDINKFLKDEAVKTLKADIPVFEIIDLRDNSTSNSTEKNGTSSQRTSVQMLKSKKSESAQPLAFDFAPTNAGGIIIINNKNNNNNEKINKVLFPDLYEKGYDGDSYGKKKKDAINIINRNDGIQLPLDSLTPLEAEFLLENAIIINNDNNNNNVT